MKKKNKRERTASIQSMLLSSKSPFTMQEAYKTLRTNVEFSLPGSDCKCIGITSANRGEGKSTIAVNLAIALSQLNKRIVLIDCDMRLPTVVTKLGISAQEGLSNYLSGIIDEVPIIHIASRGIDIIPSGAIPPDATTLINSEAMENLILSLKEMYDYIIIDYPPVNIVSDAVMLSRLMSGYIFVVRHEQSENAKIQEAIRQLSFGDAKIIGFVYNGLDVSKKYYKKSNYYYYKKSDK